MPDAKNTSFRYPGPYSLATPDTPTLPTDAAERKALPLYSFMFKYFPLAWLEVVKVAVVGNEQHNPGEPLHWAREKSTDQLDCAFRHIFDHGMGQPLDTDGCYHLAKAIWRHMAELQLICEKRAAEPAKPPAKCYVCGDTRVIVYADNRRVLCPRCCDEAGRPSDRVQGT